MEEEAKVIKEEIKKIFSEIKKNKKASELVRLILEMRCKILNLEMDDLISQKDAENLWRLIEKVKKCYRLTQELGWLDGRRI